jgi:hypothetical protein
LFHADGQTNMTKVIVGFCNFANAPKMRMDSKREVGDIFPSHQPNQFGLQVQNSRDLLRLHQHAVVLW